MWKRRWKDAKSRRAWVMPRKQYLSDTTELIHRACTSPNQTVPLFLTKMLSPINSCSQRKKNQFLEGRHWVYKPHLGANSTSSSPCQLKINSKVFSEFFFSHFALFGHLFFNFAGLWFTYYGFQF